MTFDRVIANPPFSLKNGEEMRLKLILWSISLRSASQRRGGLRVQHMISSLNAEGRMAWLPTAPFEGQVKKKLKRNY